MLKNQLFVLSLVVVSLMSCEAQKNETPLSPSEKEEARTEILQLMKSYQEAESRENVAKILDLSHQSRDERTMARSVLTSIFDKYDMEYNDVENSVIEINRNSGTVRVNRKQIRKEGPSDFKDINATIDYDVVYVDREWKIKTVEVVETTPLK